MPKHLKVYNFHGLRLDWSRGEQATGDCPFCGRENKFSVAVQTGLWRCYVCGEGSEAGGGNALTFLRALWRLGDEQTTDYKELAAEKGIADPMTLNHWGLVQSPTTGEWLAPGYSADNKIMTLYKWTHSVAGDRWLWLPTPEMGHWPHGVLQFDASKPVVYLCEGLWDGAVLWETLRATKATEDGFALTGSESSSLYADANVLAVQSCGAVGEPMKKWYSLLADKDVVLCFDSDHPTEHGGRTTEGAGFAASKRASVLLGKAEAQPASIRWLAWGPDGFDPDKKSGWDVRDVLTAGGLDIADRVAQVPSILGMVEPIPDAWLPGRTAQARQNGGTDIECVPCYTWKALRTGWKKSGMLWTDGLDYGLSVALALITSTKALGMDQLWVKMIAPASSGKSTICEALSINKRYVYANSTMRGFHSGWKTDKAGATDHGLIPKIRDKTLITKDGDTLLQAPNLSQILAEARDLYDTTARVHYRHGVERNEEGVRMTWLLCGTNSLRSIDQSELGERFLDCVLMDGIDDELEEEILWRVANRTHRGMAFETDGYLSTHHDPDKLNAMQLTGGYVDFLRGNARELLAAVDMPETSLRQCMRLGKFVAFMRARPSQKQEETAERELAARLVGQLTRLATCLAVVLNTRHVDAEVMRRVRRVAFDTARGRVLDIVRYLATCGKAGCSVEALTTVTGQDAQKERAMLRFLQRIKAVESVSAKGRTTAWRLAEPMRKLYQQVNDI